MVYGLKIPQRPHYYKRETTASNFHNAFSFIETNIPQLRLPVHPDCQKKSERAHILVACYATIRSMPLPRQRCFVLEYNNTIFKNAVCSDATLEISYLEKKQLARSTDAQLRQF